MSWDEHMTVHDEDSEPRKSFSQTPQMLASAVMRHMFDSEGAVSRESRASRSILAELVAGDVLERPRPFDLWMAAKEGRLDGVLKALDAHVDLEWELPETDENALRYKTRRVTCRPLHAAAAFGADESTFHIDKIVEELLRRKAEPSSKARITCDGKVRELEPIHFAAGAGNIKTLRHLLEYRVDPEVSATKDKKHHYHPIHDAAWFNRVECVKLLIEKRAKAEATNETGETALHLAAKLGYKDLVMFLLQDRFGGNACISVRKDAQRLVKIKTKEACGAKVPLDLAVEDGRFPPRSLFLFTNCLEPAAKVDAFVKVAHTCPEAASALLRSGHGEEDELDLCDDWRQSLQLGVRNKLIDVQILANLIQDAPRAALDLLDALTVTPEVVSQEHNPLPIRANIPNHYEACRLSCRYENDVKWVWHPVDKGRPWHAHLAPKDPKRGQEVTIKVVYLPGIIDLKLVHCLAESEDHRIFTKLVVHGLLKYVWSNFLWIFAVDLLFEIVALMVICFWIWGIRLQDELWRRNLWCLLTAQSVTQCLLFLWCSGVCLVQLDRRFLMCWLSRHWQDLLIASLTIALATLTGPDFVPSENSTILLALCALLHWVLLLYQLRAFQWTGKRIMPIMKSVMPITGMLVIMLFVSLGFVHAFWAIEAGPVDQVSLFSIVVLLFTGEHFLDDEQLRTMVGHKRDLIILLSILGVFIFLTCTINVFIAVLGDCYDQEQERTVCTFLQERARICGSLFLRPKLPVARFLGAYGWRHRCLCWCCLVLANVGAYVLVLVASKERYVASWAPVLYLFFSVVVLQCVQSDAMTLRWTEQYLWICHEANVDEDDFLAPDERQNVECRGRLARIKGYMLEQCRCVALKNKRAVLGTKREIIQHLDACFSRDKAEAKPEAAPRARWMRSRRGSEEDEPPAQGGELPEVREDLAEVKAGLEVLRKQLQQQCEAQARLERTCVDVAQALHQFFELAQRRRGNERHVALPAEAVVAPQEANVLE